MGWTNLKIKAQVNHAAMSPCNFTEVNGGALVFALIWPTLLQTPPGEETFPHFSPNPERTATV